MGRSDANDERQGGAHSAVPHEAAPDPHACTGTWEVPHVGVATPRARTSTCEVPHVTAPGPHSRPRSGHLEEAYPLWVLEEGTWFREDQGDLDCILFQEHQALATKGAERGDLFMLTTLVRDGGKACLNVQTLFSAATGKSKDCTRYATPPPTLPLPLPLSISLAVCVCVCVCLFVFALHLYSLLAFRVSEHVGFTPTFKDAGRVAI
jgi:hypothetical protein